MVDCELAESRQRGVVSNFVRGILRGHDCHKCVAARQRWGGARRVEAQSAQATVTVGAASEFRSLAWRALVRRLGGLAYRTATAAADFAQSDHRRRRRAGWFLLTRREIRSGRDEARVYLARTAGSVPAVARVRAAVARTVEASAAHAAVAVDAASKVEVWRALVRRVRDLADRSAVNTAYLAGADPRRLRRQHRLLLGRGEIGRGCHEASMRRAHVSLVARVNAGDAARPMPTVTACTTVTVGPARVKGRVVALLAVRRYVANVASVVAAAVAGNVRGASSRWSAIT